MLGQPSKNMAAWFYLPIRYVSFFGIEIDAHLDYGQFAERKAAGIVPAVDLAHGGIGILVHLQLDQVEGLRRAQHDVDAAFGSPDLHIRISP